MPRDPLGHLLDRYCQRAYFFASSATFIPLHVEGITHTAMKLLQQLIDAFVPGFLFSFPRASRFTRRKIFLTLPSQLHHLAPSYLAFFDGFNRRDGRFSILRLRAESRAEKKKRTVRQGARWKKGLEKFHRVEGRKIAYAYT